MNMNFLSSKLVGGSAIAWEEATSAHITQTIRDLETETPVIDLTVKANIEEQYVLTNTNPAGGMTRFLQATNTQTLQVEFFVDIKYRSASGDVDPASWIREAFNSEEERAAYIMRLKGNDDAFDSLESVYLLVEGIPPIEEPPEGSDDGGNNNVIIIAAAVGGGAVIMILLGLLLWNNRRAREGDSCKDDPPTSANTDVRTGVSTEIVVELQDDVSTLGDPVLGGMVMHGSGDKDEQTASVGNDYDWTKAYREANGMTSTDESSRGRLNSADSGPTRQSSSNSGFSKYGLGPMGASVFSDDVSFEEQFADASADERFEVAVPPGKLGMVIDTPNGGVPVVHAIKTDSVMADRVRVGDRLISVDGEDVTTMTAVQVSKLISLRSDQHRLLVFVRSRQRTDSLPT